MPAAAPEPAAPDGRNAGVPPAKTGTAPPLNDTAELTEDAAGAHARRAAAAPLACQKPWKRACLPYGINGWKRF